MNEALRLRLEKPQMDAYRQVFSPVRDKDTIGLGWGRGGGKSTFQRLVWWLLVSQWDGRYRPGAPLPGVRIVMLMPTLEQAKKVHAALMLAELDGDWSFLGGKVDRTHWRITFPGGSWVQWVTAERARFIRGLRCDVVTVDECDDIDPVLYDAIIVPWFSEPHSLRLSVLSGTPTRGRYGLLYRTYARHAGKSLTSDGEKFQDHFFSHATCYDFPTYVSPQAIAKAKRETVPQLFAREWLCDFDAAEGLVYPHFREDFHVRHPPPNIVWRQFIGGVDWGFEDPAALLVFGIAGGGKDVTIHLLDEVYVQHKTDTEIADQVRRLDMLYPHASWYADPSRPQSIESVRRDARVRITQADNAVDDGVATVADTLLVRERPDKSLWSQLYVSPSAENTIREFGVYRRKRDPKNRDRVLDDIDDKNNHAMDAMRYALHTHFGTPDGRIATGYGCR